MQINDYYVATSLEDAHERLVKDPKNALLGGGTWMKYTHRSLNQIIDLSKLGLNTIEENDEYIIIGALATLRDMEVYPAIKKIGDGFLSQALGSIMGVNFRNIATIGGSIFGKFSFSDILTPLLTLQVTVKLYPKEEKSLESFLEDKGDRTKILTHLVIRKENGKGYFKKVAQVINDFSLINLAIFRGEETRVAVGGRPQRAKRIIEALQPLHETKNLNDDALKKMATDAISELRFGDDERGTASYRKALAEIYLYRGLKEVYQQ